MSTVFTHVVVPLSVGLGLGRRTIPWRVLLVGCLFSILPDIDVIGFELGVSYYSPWGHRGFTHSVVFALFCAAATTCYFRVFETRPVIIFLFLTIAMVSHGLLDALTYGGLGVAFAWPIDDSRYFFSTRPLPVSTIGIKRFFNFWGRYVLEKEMVLVWLPMLGLCGVILLARLCAKLFYRCRREQQ